MNITAETLALLKAAQSEGVPYNGDLAKSVTTGTGLVAYDLQAPAKNLYPVRTPIRNTLPRVGGGQGLATNWKQVSAITGSGYDAMPWVAEGQRSARMSYTTASKSASYVTLGEEDQVSFEAESAGRGFEDIRASAGMRLLQKMMLKEENALLFGNASLSLGTPTTPTLSASGSGATLPGAPTTYSVIVVALTGEGYRNSSLAGGVATSQTITGADGQTFTLSGGSSQKSAAATQAVTLGQTLYASTPAINGAVGYAWFVGTAGNEKLEAITTINSVSFSAALAGTHQAATAITADNSKNANYAFDGLFTAAFSGGGYVKALATGTAGTGTTLTASGRGSVDEIDAMLQGMWDAYQVSPTVLYVNSQQLKDISKKVLTGASSAPLLRYNNDASGEPYSLEAGGTISSYFNPFSYDGGSKIPVKIHPFVPAGTIIGWSANLPEQYQSNNVPNVAEVKVRRDYYQIDWPLRSRQYEMGVYSEEVLAVYAPFAMGIISNVAAG